MRRMFFFLTISFACAAAAVAQPEMIIRDDAGTIRAKVFSSHIVDGTGATLGRMEKGAFIDENGVQLGQFRIHSVYSPTGNELLSGKEFGRVIRWRTGNIAFRIDTLDGAVRLVNSFGVAELSVEGFTPNTHFIPLMFYLAFYHTSPTAPPGYEKTQNIWNRVIRSAKPLTLDSPPVAGEITQEDLRSYGGESPVKLERRIDVYRFSATGPTAINIEVKYESKEIDVRLIDAQSHLVDPSDALTVDRNEGMKSYPYALKAGEEYLIVVDGYPVAPYTIKVTR